MSLSEGLYDTEEIFSFICITYGFPDNMYSVVLELLLLNISEQYFSYIMVKQ